MRRRLLALLALAAVAGTGTGCGGDDGPEAGTTEAGARPVRLGTKNFTEQFVLGELYRQALEARGFRVELKQDVGSSEVIDAALRIGTIDMYPEYTGVMLSEIAGERSRPPSADAAFARARAFQASRGYRLLARTPFTDSNALAVRPALARRYRLRTVADLARLPGRVRIGAPPEFRARFEGLVGLGELYGLTDLDVRALRIGDQYEALDRGRVEVAAVFTTDGQLSTRPYVVLRDPRRLFSFQNVAPVVNPRVLGGRPGLARTVDAVSRRLTTRAMRAMNAEVDLRDRRPAAVARDFLRSAGLVR